MALTGLGRDDNKHVTQAAQFDEDIVKPTQMADFLRIAEQVSSKRRGRHTSMNRAVQYSALAEQQTICPHIAIIKFNAPRVSWRETELTVNSPAW